MLARAVQTAVRGATSLSCSLGVGTSKVVAKVASDRRKPGGITVVLPGREAEFLAPFDLRLLPGIGPRTEERLRARGLDTLGALAAAHRRGARARCCRARSARLLRDRARGIDPRGLEGPSENVSISHEETFARDVGDRDALHAELRRMAGAPRRAPRRLGPRRADGDDEGALPRLRDPQPLDLAPGRHRRRRADRRPRLRAARPRARRPPGRAAARRRRRLEPRGLPAAGAAELRGAATRPCGTA